MAKLRRYIKSLGGVALYSAEGERLAESLGANGKLLILRNHGLLTVGQTVVEAAYLFTLAEKSCGNQLQMEAAAANTIPKMVIDDQVAKYTFEMTSEAVRIPCVSYSAAFYLKRTTRRHYTASSNLNMNMSWKGQTGKFLE